MCHTLYFVIRPTHEGLGHPKKNWSKLTFSATVCQSALLPATVGKAAAAGLTLTLINCYYRVIIKYGWLLLIFRHFSILKVAATEANSNSLQRRIMAPGCRAAKSNNLSQDVGCTKLPRTFYVQCTSDHFSLLAWLWFKETISLENFLCLYTGLL